MTRAAPRTSADVCAKHARTFPALDAAARPGNRILVVCAGPDARDEVVSVVETREPAPFAESTR